MVCFRSLSPGACHALAHFGEVIEAGKSYRLELGLNQDNLASLVGARREWVNRLLQNWQRQGWMEYRAGKVIIHDLARMQQERDRREEAHQTTTQRRTQAAPSANQSA